VVDESAEVSVVAAVTGEHGNPSYASELQGQPGTPKDDERDEGGKDTEEDGVTSELDEEARRRLEAEIEGLVVTEKTEDGEGVMPAEQEPAAENSAVLMECSAEDEVAAADADADASTAAEGIISAGRDAA